MAEGVHAGDAIQLAQDRTGLNSGTASTKPLDGDFPARHGLGHVGFFERGYADSAHLALAQDGVELRHVRLEALADFEIALTGRIEYEVADAFLLLEDRTDPLRLRGRASTTDSGRLDVPKLLRVCRCIRLRRSLGLSR